MTRLAVAGYVALTLVGAALVWVLFVALPRWYGPQSSPTEEGTPDAQVAAVRKIKARVFFVSQGGDRLVAVEQEVPYGEGTIEQARLILAAQFADAPAPLASAIPAGTTLRTIFVTARGEAYVDLSAEVSTAHPGGSMNEIFTVYTIVNALTANLPAITGVQILVNGQEVDTLAGHVDLRRPLQQDLQWLDTSQAVQTPTAGIR